VSRHYYIDDVGRQSSVVAYGYAKLGKPKPTEKADHFVGKIYTVTCCIVEINRLKKLQSKNAENPEELAKANRELDEWVSISAELREKYPELFDTLLKEISSDEDPEGEISRLNRAYEDGQPNAKELIREVSNLCLDGFRATMQRVGVNYDSWDWKATLSGPPGQRGTL
jgi:arginyl-tRNA synthetase